MARPSFSSALALGACFAVSVVACFFYIGGLSPQTLGVSALCGAVAVILRALLRLPPAVVGFIVAFLPAVVIPDAFFIGLGLIFIVASVLTGALFSVAHAVVVKRSSPSLSP
jgi:hypothetical protein